MFLQCFVEKSYAYFGEYKCDAIKLLKCDFLLMNCHEIAISECSTIMNGHQSQNDGFRFYFELQYAIK